MSVPDRPSSITSSRLWDYRHFIYYDAQARVQTGNEQDRLGRAWLVLGPLLNGLMFYLIMGVSAEVRRRN